MTKQKAKDATMKVTVDGVDYVLELAEVTGWHEHLLRKECGVSIQEVIGSAKNSAGLDTIAQLLYLSHLTNGNETISFRDVASSISLDSEITTTDDAEPLPKDPEDS